VKRHPTWKEALGAAAGSRRTAALTAWFQGLFGAIAEAPILVGGAAVELFTEGGYVTGDLDFVGSVPPPVAAKLREVGFRRQGRHWVHEGEQIFLELPGERLEPDEPPIERAVGPWTVRIVSAEGLLVDRLAAVKFWRSETDAANALLLLRSDGIRWRPRVLRRLARELDVEDEVIRLRRFAKRLGGRRPTDEEVRRWIRREASRH
jgi:hypothetical protein